MGRGRVAIVALGVVGVFAGTAWPAHAAPVPGTEISGVAFRSTVQPDVIDFYVRVHEPPPSATAVDSLVTRPGLSVTYEVSAGRAEDPLWTARDDEISTDPTGNYEDVTSDVLERAQKTGRARYSVRLTDATTGAVVDEVSGELPTRFKSDGWQEDVEITGRPKPQREPKDRHRPSAHDSASAVEGEAEEPDFHRDEEVEELADDLSGVTGFGLEGGGFEFGEVPFSTSETAEIRDGRATAPQDAPRAVRQIIRAGNAIATTPYLWGGGHGSWQAPGYDCSGSVSYALRGAGLVDSSMVSTGFITFGEPGPGKWVTIYANGGHVFMVVAGLRFDTTGRDAAGTRWQAEMRSTGSFIARHPAGL